MDESDGFILFIVGSAVGIILFFGVVKGIQKAFTEPPDQKQSTPNQYLSTSKESAKETRENLRELNRDRKQQLRDMQRMQRR